MRTKLCALCALGLALGLTGPARAGEDDVATLFEAGVKAEAARDFKAAFEKFDQVMDLDENHRDVFKRWEACERLAEWQESIEGKPTAMDLVRLGEVYLELARLREEEGDDDSEERVRKRLAEEIAAYEEAIEIDPECADAHGHLALAHYTSLSENGDLTTVIEETAKLLETSPYRDQLARARADFEVFGRLRIMRQEIGDVLQKAGMAKRKRRFGQAAEILMEAAKEEIPDAYRTVLLTEAGKFLMQGGDRDGAKDAFLMATRHAACTTTIQARLGLAAIAVGQGDLETALDHLRAAVAEGSDACKMIARQRTKAFEALFTAEDESIRKEVEALSDPWEGDRPIRERIAAAVKEAEAGGKKVLILWYGPYCPYVMAMEERLVHPKIQEVLGKHYILVRIDLGSHHRGDTVNEEYGDPVGMNGVPSFLILNADGSTHSLEKDTNLMGADHRCYDVEKIVTWLTKAARD